MPTYGQLKRDFPRLEVLRGFDPNEPRTQTAAYRVKSGETVLSGMVVSPVWHAADNVYEWRVGVASTAAPVYFALQDSADADVLEAGNLVGLSCAGQFELQTPFYDGEDVYNEGVFLISVADGTALNAANNDTAVLALGRTSAAAGNGKGFVAVAVNASAVTIVGQVTRAQGSAGDGTPYNSLDGINSNVVIKNVITFRTMYKPALTD